MRPPKKPTRNPISSIQVREFHVADVHVIQPAQNDGSAKARTTARWQKITLASLFTGYAGYYLCRSNLAGAAPQLIDEFVPPASA